MMDYRCRKILFSLLSFATICLSACVDLKGNVADPPLLNRTYSSISISGTGGEVGTTTTATVTMVDSQGYGFANITPVITAYNSSGSNAGITYSACGVTNSYGVAVCYITSKEAGTFTLALSSPTSAGGGTVTFTQVARSLSFVAQPSSSNTSKTAFTTQPIVRVVDNVGNAMASADGINVTVALTSAGNATLSGTAIVATAGASSQAAFTNLSVDVAGTYTLTATAVGITSAVSSSFAVVAGAATKIAFTKQPSTTTAANTAFAIQPVVSLEDSAGNVVTSGTCSVTMTLSTKPNAADMLLGQFTKAMVSGVADYSNLGLRINTTLGGTTYVLKATPTGASCGTFAAITTNAFAITIAGIPATIAVATAPTTSSINALWPTEPVINVLDAFGNLCTTDNSTVITVSYSPYTSPPAGVSLVGSTTIGVTNGVATFSDLEITGASTTDAGTYTLNFTAADPVVTTIAAVSTSFYVNTNGLVPATLVFNKQPAKATKGQTMNSFSVEELDANGVVCADDNTSSVTITLAGTGGGSAAGTLTQTVVNGVATFNNIAVNAAGSYQFDAVDTVTTPVVTTLSANSTFFGITSFGNADHPAFTQQPSSTSTTAGADFTTQPKVAIEDVAGNVVTNDNSSVITLSCVAPSGCTLLGTTSQTVANGVATFTNLYFSGSEAGATLLATISSTSATTLTSTQVDSASFTVSAAGTTPSKLSFTTEPSTTSNVESAALTTQPVVSVLTAAGTVANTDNSTVVTLSCIAPSGCTLAGTTSVTDVNGVATFVGVGVNEPTGTGGIILQATATNLSSTNSTVFAIP